MVIHIIYTLLIVIWGMSINLSKKKARKSYIWGVSIILILISGLRNMYVGPDDTYNYFNTFNNIKQMSYTDCLDVNKDPIFSLFTKVLQIFIGGNFQLYLIICASILLIPLGRFFYRESHNPMISYLMFISLGFFSFSMVCIRQSMAIGVLLLSYDALRQHKLIKFILFVLLASCFHLSALIFLLIYPMSYLKYNMRMLLIYLVAVVLSIVMGQEIVGSFDLSLIDARFGGYQLGESRVLSAAGLVQLILFGLVYAIYYRKVQAKNPEEANLQCHFLSLAMVFQGLVFVIAEFFRVSWYFKAYVLILIPMILAYSGKQRKALTLAFGLLFLAYFFINVGNNDYAFFWQYYKPNF